MTGPLYMLGAFGYWMSLLLATVIGFLFGFVLERAGFADSRNLTNVFYFRDMRVLKVMFSALCTGMVGLLVLSWVGLFDYSVLLKHSLLETYLWPQLVGGVLFGLGFVMGGYCPGTSMVGIVSGKIDAVAFMLGMFVGIYVYAAGFPLWGDFSKASDMGRITLWELFGIPMPLMAVIVLVVAFFAFWLASLGERWAPYDKITR
ncbi:MAG: YeeE/YedE family protein [Deltaproteobacteria bacterium]|nr:YeeE/YedE family protein [Deltaproteobacteria bacterium]